ncbi:2-dehydropantoate 2-reductase N-terminal domain-containing protein [Streptomyces sp. NPDC006923]|uniref:ketopantoate reductase family protein n=1 Tax=Streptomyces sp. NPDC006923 TaxID=3155355 RepID=UPI0033E5285E
MRVLVVGAGAVGGCFGALLVRSGAEVAFLVRGSRLTRLDSEGLRIAGADGATSSVPVVTINAADLKGHYDLILLAVKGTALTGALTDVAPAAGGSTAVLVLLNGIRHVDILREALGARRVLGGVSLAATELGPDGLIRQVSPGASARGPPRRRHTLKTAHPECGQ